MKQRIYALCILGMLAIDSPSIAQSASGQSSAFKEIVEKALQQSALLRTPMTLMREGRYAEAIRSCTMLITQHPTFVAAYLTRSKCYLQLSDFAHALADANTAIQFSPRDMTAYRNRSNVYIAMRRPDLARADLERIQLLRKDGIIKNLEETGMMFGTQRLQPAQLHEAVTDLTNMSGVTKGGIAVPKGESVKVLEHENAASKFRKSGQLDKAIVEMEAALKLSSNDAQRFTLAHDYFDQGSFEKSIEEFSKLIKNSTFRIYSLNLRAASYAALGKDELAIYDYSQVLEDPRAPLPMVDAAMKRKYGPYACYNRSDVLGKRAQLYSRRKQYDKAISDCTEALSLAKSDQFFLTRAEAYRMSSSPEKALDDYTSILTNNPKDEQAYSLRGDLYLSLGRTNEAVADYTKSIALDPKDAWRCYDGRAKAYDQLGSKDLADADRKKAQELGFSTK